MSAILAAILGFFAYPLVVGIFGTILTISFIAAAEHEDEDLDCLYGWSLFLTIVAALVYYKQIHAFFNDWSWHFILIAFATYGILGCANSVFRWYKLCRKFIEEHPHLTASEYTEQLCPSEYKNQLIGWIVFWPWSLFWNILGDFLTGVYDALVNTYTRIAAYTIKKATNRPQ